jgi:hypothetical protein
MQHYDDLAQARSPAAIQEIKAAMVDPGAALSAHNPSVVPSETCKPPNLELKSPTARSRCDPRFECIEGLEHRCARRRQLDILQDPA